MYLGFTDSCRYNYLLASPRTNGGSILLRQLTVSASEYFNFGALALTDDALFGEVEVEVFGALELRGADEG